MNGPSWVTVFVTAVIALSFCSALLPILLAFRHSRRKLELDHLARMKALEMGHPVRMDGGPQGEPWSLAARVALGIGVVVPLSSLVGAFVASKALGFHEAIWVTSGMIALAGIICGGALASKKLGNNHHSHDVVGGKSTVDEDSYDVAGARW